MPQQINKLNPRGGRLFQQYVFTAYCSIDQNRIDHIREKYNDNRNEYLFGLYDTIMRKDRDGSHVGTHTIIPASFTRGLRYIYIATIWTPFLFVASTGIHYFSLHLHVTLNGRKLRNIRKDFLN